MVGGGKKMQCCSESCFYFTGSAHGRILVSEDSETWRNDTSPNLTFDQLHEKLKLAMQREKLLKVQ